MVPWNAGNKRSKLTIGVEPIAPQTPGSSVILLFPLATIAPHSSLGNELRAQSQCNRRVCDLACCRYWHSRDILNGTVRRITSRGDLQVRPTGIEPVTPG